MVTPDSSTGPLGPEPRAFFSVPKALPVFPGYELQGELGRGGMGVVYRARQLATGCDVAIKAIRPGFADDSRAERRFIREITALSELRHKRIVAFLEAGEAHETLFIVMEYLQTIDLPRELAGRSLASRIRLATGLMSQVLDALDFAHARSWLHRDLKPGNVLIQAEGKKWRAKVSDFGLAKNLESAGISCVTEAGQTLGSLPFMAPEQLHAARDVTGAADLYSAGATLYCWLTQRGPLDFPKGCDPLRVVADCQIVPIDRHEPALPPALAEFIHRALAKEPSQRFPTAAVMRAELDGLRQASASAE